MLKELKIKNLALIEQLHIQLEKNLTVFTGETGAGKSIVLQAIDLLSGGRAAASWVRSGMDMAEVEALFELPDNQELRQSLDEMGVEEDGELLIRRVLLKDGKSRFYLNGGLATSKLVSKISEYLLSVASQHDHQQLLVPKYHLDFIDLVGELWGQREEVSALYGQWAEARREYAAFKEKEIGKEQRRDFLGYQLQEIEAAHLVAGEDVVLTDEKMRLKSSADLNRLGCKCYGALTHAATALTDARKDFEAMALLDGSIVGLTNSVVEQSYLLEDHMKTVRGYIDTLPQDDSQLEEIAARIHLLQQLKRKYGGSLEDVIAHAQQVGRELEELDSLDSMLLELDQRCKKIETSLLDKASALSLARKGVAKTLEESLEKELHGLSFEQSAFEVAFQQDKSDTPLASLTFTGIDRVEFLFSANPGEPLKPLAKIASGGELSRVLLAMKCILARKDLVETVVFDEVDAGIGGKAAEAVAKKIKELAQHHQVLCITHLPQIAACGHSHFMVEKSLSNGRTRTAVIPLERRQRVDELARMLDGKSVSQRTMAFAEELIARNAS